MYNGNEGPGKDGKHSNSRPPEAPQDPLVAALRQVATAISKVRAVSFEGHGSNELSARRDEIALLLTQQYQSLLQLLGYRELGAAQTDVGA